VWLAGDESQKSHAAGVVLDGGAAALALTEREHGSDIGASEVRATATAEGYRLEGTKWLINNATRGRLLSVFARTREAGGLRGFSLLLVDKQQLAIDGFSCLPKIRTLGIRGADISGIRFKGARVGRDSVIKREGAGLDVVLRGLFVTRTLCSSFSLGAFDTGLRTTLDFAASRRLYGASMIDLQAVRRNLTGAWADLIACECVSVAATRLLHVRPEQASVSSAVAKYLVPTLTEAGMQTLSVTLGARHYLREEHVHGIFQKMMRDNAVVGLFDGSTAINLTLIAQQLPLLLRERATEHDAAAFERNRIAFRLTESLPPFAPDRLALDNFGRSDVLDSMHPGVVQETRAIGGPCAEGLAEAVGGILAWRTGLRERVLAAVDARGAAFAKTAAALDLAAEFSGLYAAAACYWFWVHNRDVAAVDTCADVTLLALQRLLRRHGRPAPPHDTASEVLERLLTMHREEQLFSALRIPLGTRESRGS